MGKFGKSKLAEAKQKLNRELDKLKKHVGIFKKGLFHGCYTFYKDGTRVPLDRNQECLTAPDYPFWKMIKDINVKIETRVMHKQKKRPPSLTWANISLRIMSNVLKSKLIIL